MTKPFYVSVVTPDERLLKGCNPPFEVVSVNVKPPLSSSVTGNREGWESVITAKISGTNVMPGLYTVTVNIRNAVSYHKFFTVSIYA